MLKIAWFIDNINTLQNVRVDQQSTLPYLHMLHIKPSTESTIQFVRIIWRSFQASSDCRRTMKIRQIQVLTFLVPTSSFQKHFPPHYLNIITYLKPLLLRYFCKLIIKFVFGCFIQNVARIATQKTNSVVVWFMS